MDHTRDPCPWVILNDFGGAFCMGVRLPTPLAINACTHTLPLSLSPR